MAKLDKDSKRELIFPWAFHMAGLLVRNPIIARDLGLTKNESQTIWQKVNGRSSPSGMGPWSADWYCETVDRRFQSALLILMYNQSAKVFPKFLALPYTFYHFARLTAGEWKVPKSTGRSDPAFRSREHDYTIPYSRALALVTEMDKAKNGDHIDLLIKSCKACNSKFMAKHDEGGNKCPLCD